MTITGTNFVAGATVTFGATAATNVTVVNSTTITATTPAGSAGAVTVTVTNPGRAEREPGQCIYLRCSADGEQCAPNSGALAGGTAVTITGTNFAAGATVKFGSDGGDQRGGGEQHDDHGDDTGGECRRGDGDGDQQQRAEWKPGQRIYLRCTADGEQCESEQRVDGGRNGGDDHGDELCRRARR